MEGDAKKISLWDTLRLQLFVTVPAFLWGLVAPNPLFVTLLCRWDAGRATVRFIEGLRRKYGCDHLWVHFPVRKTLLVLDPASIDAVLRSDENTADPDLKKRALSRFVPDALIVSRGSAWEDRRRFNESALEFGKLHAHHDAFNDIVSREVGERIAAPSGTLRWSDFGAVAQGVSHQVVLGSGRLEPGMAVHLAHLVQRANWAFLPPPAHGFAAFYERIDAQLDRHRAALRTASGGPQPGGQPVPTGCLMHDSARLVETGSTTAVTQVPRQIGFWFFVLKDAMELHVARTLALIAAHPAVQERVRDEIRRAPGLSAYDIDRFAYLDACLMEQLRLWTPVPILLRRANRSFSLRGEIPIRAEEQILIHAGFQHRDSLVLGATADRFSPDAVTDTFPPLYVFSRHRQSCAGQFLARFLIKAALAWLLAKHRFELVAPSIDPVEIPHLCDHFKIELRAFATP
jgi:cytochrome P450